MKKITTDSTDVLLDAIAATSTDVLLDAIAVTSAVYLRNAYKFIVSHQNDLAMVEVQRAALMTQLLKDDDLVEMLAGRIHQLSHGTPKPKPPKE